MPKSEDPGTELPMVPGEKAMRLDDVKSVEMPKPEPTKLYRCYVRERAATGERCPVQNVIVCGVTFHRWRGQFAMDSDGSFIGGRAPERGALVRMTDKQYGAVLRKIARMVVRPSAIEGQGRIFEIGSPLYAPQVGDMHMGSFLSVSIVPEQADAPSAEPAALV